jgi:hypothetical protein
MQWRILKNFPAEIDRIQKDVGQGVEIEVWFQDEARVGQSEADKKTGLGPRFPAEQDHAALGQAWHTTFGPAGSAHTFGLDFRGDLSSEGNRRGPCPARLQHPRDGPYLVEISKAIAPGAHGVLIARQAGWHTTPKLGDWRGWFRGWS